MRRALTAEQIISVGNAINCRVRKLPNGFCEYIAHGDNDFAIAKELGVSEKAVSNLRLRIVGKIKDSGYQAAIERRAATLAVSTGLSRPPTTQPPNHQGKPKWTDQRLSRVEADAAQVTALKAEVAYLRNLVHYIYGRLGEPLPSQVDKG